MMTELVPERIRTLERPHRALWIYYIIVSICTGPGIVVMLPYLYFRYHTLRYRFDDEGIHMKVGLLFRRETNLTYARIQDIHLRSGILQRWLGLANVQVQTASGSSGPELIIEGFKEFEAIRDFLYTRMRGYQGLQGSSHAAALALPGGVGPSARGDIAPAAAGAASAPGEAEIVSLLLGIRDELRRTREALAARDPGARPPQMQPPQPPSHV
jgi:membrane protein YdbS with pleckstrin-like domain